MKTADLVVLLAQDSRPVPPGLARRRIAAAAVAGGAIAFAAVVFWLKCQPLLEAAHQPWFWMKAAYTSALAGPALVMAQRLSRPGATLRRAPAGVLLAILLMGLLGAAQLVLAPASDRLGLWLGETWRVCSPLILLLSAPIYVCLVLAFRTLAPTRSVQAGASAGLAAGSLAATRYGLHYPERSAAFVFTWYSLGIAGATGLGAAAGRWLLRW